MDCGYEKTDCDCEDGFNPPRKVATEPVAAGFNEGFNHGEADGRRHQKRKYYEDDKLRDFKKVSTTYVEGYLTGYKMGRRG